MSFVLHFNTIVGVSVDRLGSVLGSCACEYVAGWVFVLVRSRRK